MKDKVLSWHSGTIPNRIKLIMKEQKENAKNTKKSIDYDDFTAQVYYDLLLKKDFVDLYWDSYFIKECTDSQHLSLYKSQYGTPKITIAKKYSCVCQICGKKTEILSSDFKIRYNDEYGFYPEICCPCHTVSSFEAKTIDILNQLGVAYIRKNHLRGW